MDETRPSHPSAFDLQRHSLAAHGGEPVPEVAAHLDGCQACRDYLASLELQREDLMTRRPPQEFAAAVSERALPQSRRPARPRLRVALTAAAAALTASAAALLAFWFVLHAATPDDDGLRMMGSDQVTAYLQRGEQVTEVTKTETVTAGNAVGFTVRLNGPTHIAVFFMDDEGQVSWSIPTDPKDPPLVLPAGQHELPGSAVFDDSLRPDRAFVVMRDGSFDVLAVSQGIQQAWQQADPVAFDDDAWIPKGDDTWSTVFNKR